MKANADIRCVSVYGMYSIKLCRLITPQNPQCLDKEIVGKKGQRSVRNGILFDPGWWM